MKNYLGEAIRSTDYVCSPLRLVGLKSEATVKKKRAINAASVVGNVRRCLVLGEIKERTKLSREKAEEDTK